MLATQRTNLLRWGMAGLLITAFAIRAFTLTNQSLWRDEVDALRFAIAPWHEMLGTFTQPGWNGPLYFVLLRGWVALTGQSEFTLRYLSLFFGVLAVALAFGLSRRLTDSLTALLCSALFATSPYLTWYSQEVKMYSLVLALAVLAVYALRRAIGHPEPQGGEGSRPCDKATLRFRFAQNDTTMGSSAGWWMTLVAATSIAMYCHILAALLIPVEMILALVWGIGSGDDGWWKGALVSFACLTLPYLPLLRWQLPLVLTPAQTGFVFYPFNQMLMIMLSGFATGVSGKLPTTALWPMGSLVLIGIALSPARWRDKAVLLIWLLLPPLALFLISLNRPIFTDRYLIWIGPAFYLLVSLGVVAVWRLWKPLGMVAFVAMLGIAMTGVYDQAATPIKTDFRSAARYVSAHQAPGDLVIFQIPYVRYTFDYYHPQPYDWADGLFTNYGMSDADVDAQMWAMVAGRKTVWLVASEMEMWDRNLQVWKWLESHARRADSVEFTLVTLYQYEF
jgi:mannosyltransferase